MTRGAGADGTEPDGSVVAAPIGFAEFYEREWSGAVRLAALLTQSTTAAEDVAQDAFVRVYPHWASARNPGGYLRVTLVNVCRNRQRHAGVHQSKLPLLVEPASVELATSDLADAVAGLPYRQRAVLVLRYHLGQSEAEIAEALGVRAGTVKSLSARALARLAKELPR